MAKEEIYRAHSTTADILAHPQTPQTISKNDSQLLFGERFAVTKKEGEWLYGHSLHDGYEGHVHQSNLVKDTTHTTHFVDVAQTHIYAAPDFKSRPIKTVSMLSYLALLDQEKDGFVETSDGWIFAHHLKSVEELKDKAPLETALAFLNTPYLYGGRSSLGIDCSGLVQIALMRNGLKCPRDSGDQSALGKPVDFGQHHTGDLVFFPGHVGFLTDNNTVLNASARTMNTHIEPLETLIDQYGEIEAIKRL